MKNIFEDLNKDLGTEDIGKKPEFFKTERTPEEKELIEKWKGFYEKFFPEKSIDLSNVEIPKKTMEDVSEYARLIICAEGITDEMLFQKCAELFPTSKFTERDLDEIVNDSADHPKGTYAVWIPERKEIEAAIAKHENKQPPGFMEPAERDPRKTLKTRLLQELAYFNDTGYHLNGVFGTICEGSRYNDGYIPVVSWENVEEGKEEIMFVGYISDGPV